MDVYYWTNVYYMFTIGPTKRNTFTAPSEILSCIQVWISDAIRKTLTPRQHRKLTVKKSNSLCSSELVKAWGDSPAPYSDSLESNLYSFITSFLWITCPDSNHGQNPFTLSSRGVHGVQC